MRLTLPFTLTLVAPLLLALGCAKDKQADRAFAPPAPDPAMPAAVDPAPTKGATEPSVPPDRMDARLGTIEALTRKAESYARELEPRTTRGTSPPAATVAEPSVVQWLNVDEFHLSPHQVRTAARIVTATESPAVVKPAIETSPVSANRAETVAFVPPSHAAGSNAAAEVPRAPAAVPSGDSEVASLRQKLAARVKDYPRDIANHLELQLLMFLTDQPVPDMALMASLPPEDRELLAAIIDGIANFRSAVRADNNMLLSRKVRPIVEMASRVRTQAELSIPTLALCTRVMGFGVYDPIEPARFPAGREHHAIIYCEVENFASTLSAAGLWETKLTLDIVLYTETGLAVWTDKTETITDQSRGRRTDFFVRKMIKLPASLTIGRYLLKVTIVDQQANRVAEASVPLVVNAQ